MSRVSPKIRLRRLIEYASYQKRLWSYQWSNKPTRFPSLFCIQTTNQCNASCIMCPNAQTKNTTLEQMTDSLFERIIQEIALKHLPHTYIYLFLQNEPLMDKTIFKKIRFINDISNNTIKTGLVSNGTLFSKEKIKALETSKLDELFISVDAVTKETYNTIRPGLCFQQLLHNIDNIIDSSYKGYFGVRFVLQQNNQHELTSFRHYWKEKKIPIQISTVANRSGDVQEYGHLQVQHKKGLVYTLRRGGLITNGCITPLLRFNILAIGDVLLCCDDFKKKTILGTINNTTIQNLWASSSYQHIRKCIQKANYQEIDACRSCSKIQTT